VTLTPLATNIYSTHLLTGGSQRNLDCASPEYFYSTHLLTGGSQRNLGCANPEYF